MRLWLQQRNYQFTIGKCRSTADLQISYIEQAGAAPSLYTTECQASTGSFYPSSCHRDVSLLVLRCSKTL